MGILDPGFLTYLGVIAGIYALLALGLYIQFSMAGLPNFGHVAFMAVAAYTMAILIIRYAVPWPIAVGAGFIPAAAFALLVGIPSLRLRSDYLAIVTVAGSEIVRYVAMNAEDVTGGPVGSIAMAGPNSIAVYDSGPLALIDSIRAPLEPYLGNLASRDFVMFIFVWILAIFFLALARRLEASPWGRVLKSIREDEDAAASVGKDVYSYKLQALLIGSLLGALAGMLLAVEIGVFSPIDYQPTLTFYAYLILILGGLNRVWAIPLGAVAFGLIYSGTRFLDFYPLSLVNSGDRAFLRLLFVGVLLVAFMAIRPQGLLGNRRELLLEK
jgi:ABC-type branched-subunit amino acid transport system permease subunit